MKIDRRRKNIISIVALTSMTIFSLFAVFSGAFAWFTSVNSLAMSGDQFPVVVGTGHLDSITFHQMVSKTMDASTGEATSFTFDPNPVGTISYDWGTDSASFTPTSQGDTSIALSDYEPLDREHPLLLMFRLNDSYDTTSDPITIKATAQASGYLGEKNADATPKYRLQDDSVVYKKVDGTDYYWLSSVVQSYNCTFVDDDSTSYQMAVDSAYATAHSLPLLGNNSKFVTADNERDTCSFSAESTLFTSGDGGMVKNIAVVIDYYPDAIEYIYSTYLGNTVLEDVYDGILHYWCDWTMEVF